MNTKAKVIFSRKSTGMVAAETGPGTVTVLELLGCEQVKPGDILVGCMDELHNQEFYNETQGEKMRVFIHDRGCELHEAIERYFTPVMSSVPPRRPMWPLGDPAVIR
jgi:hypothetical protein